MLPSVEEAESRRLSLTGTIGEEKTMEDKLLLKELCRYNIGTYADILYRNAILYPNDEAFVYGLERITFSHYNARVNSLIHALNAMGVKKGDVIGILSWNCLDYVDFLGAAMKGGFIASPFNPRLQADELDYLINYSEANTLFVGPELLETVDTLRPRTQKIRNFISVEGPAAGMYSHIDLLKAHSNEEPDIRVEEDDPFIIFYTSGTTGVPRGALYTQRRKMEDTRLFAFGLSVEHGNREIMAIPLFHVAGASYLLAFFYGGGVNIIYPQRAFDPAATLQMIQDERATDIHIVPTNLVSMLALPDAQKYDLSSLKRIWYAGSPMPVEVLKKGMDIFGPVFIQAYGQSESGPFASKLPKRSHQVLDKPPEEQKILASCGQPCPGVHMRIVDGENQDLKPGEVGEIVIKSRSIMAEYWEKPEETRNTVKDGWLHTGDMGYYDETGNIYLVDRKKDMIISGGENVYPREVEEILYHHSAIQEVAVIGLPDPYWVEKVHAVIVLKEGASAKQGELIDFCKERLARYKAPKSVDFVESLPKNPQGKILKRKIREAYRKGAKKTD
jgi:acyl-CoA synthetase (AMP-forming)/AMP-acid ligase II